MIGQCDAQGHNMMLKRNMVIVDEAFHFIFMSKEPGMSFSSRIEEVWEQHCSKQNCANNALSHGRLGQLVSELWWCARHQQKQRELDYSEAWDMSPSYSATLNAIKFYAKTRIVKHCIRVAGIIRVWGLEEFDRIRPWHSRTVFPVQKANHWRKKILHRSRLPVNRGKEDLIMFLELSHSDPEGYGVVGLVAGKKKEKSWRVDIVARNSHLPSLKHQIGPCKVIMTSSEIGGSWFHTVMSIYLRWRSRLVTKTLVWRKRNRKHEWV
jgi:hypothetical protein